MVEHQRVGNWPKLLSLYITEKRTEPFKWGDNDCLMFIAKWLEICTGRNIYDEYLGYSTEEQANIILQQNGGAEAILTKSLGPGSRKYLSAKRGDIVIIKLPLDTAGIVDDSGQFVVAVGFDGLMKFPLKMIWKVWNV